MTTQHIPDFEIKTCSSTSVALTHFIFEGVGIFREHRQDLGLHVT